MGERDDARHQVEQKRARVSAIALEVSRRMTPEYAKERAKEMARHRAMDVRERAVESSWFAPVVGAGIGALVARAIASRAQDHRGDRYSYGYGAERWDEEEARRRYYGSGYRTEERYDYGARLDDEQLAGPPAESKGLASEVKERVSARADEVTGKLREGTSALRERIPDRERLRASAYEDTGIWAFGALALGALFGLALPVSEKERELLDPAKRKLREATEQAKTMAMEKGSEAIDQASARMEGRSQQEEDEDRGPSRIVPPDEPATPIH